MNRAATIFDNVGAKNTDRIPSLSPITMAASTGSTNAAKSPHDYSCE